MYLISIMFRSRQNITPTWHERSIATGTRPSVVDVYDRSIGLLIFPTQPLITPSTSAYMHRLIALVHEHRCWGTARSRMGWGSRCWCSFRHQIDASNMEYVLVTSQRFSESANKECTLVMSLAVVLYDYGMYRMTSPIHPWNRAQLRRSVDFRWWGASILIEWPVEHSIDYSRGRSTSCGVAGSGSCGLELCLSRWATRCMLLGRPSIHVWK